MKNAKLMYSKINFLPCFDEERGNSYITKGFLLLFSQQQTSRQILYKWDFHNVYSSTFHILFNHFSSHGAA